MEQDFIQLILFFRTRDFFDFLPLNNTDKVPSRFTDDIRDRQEKSLDTLAPLHPNQPYDMHDIINKIVRSSLLPTFFLTLLAVAGHHNCWSVVSGTGFALSLSASSPLNPLFFGLGSFQLTL